MPNFVQPLSARARWILKTSLILVWVLAVGSLVFSCSKLSFYRKPIPSRTPLTAPPSNSTTLQTTSVNVLPSFSAPTTVNSVPPTPSIRVMTELQTELEIDILDRFRRTRLPLTIAHFLLSIALVMGTSRTLGRKPGGRMWLRQVCLAMVVFVGSEYYLSRNERTYRLQQSLEIAHSAYVTKTSDLNTLTRTRVLSDKLLFVFQLMFFGGLFVALGRPSVELELAPFDRERPPPSEN